MTVIHDPSNSDDPVVAEAIAEIQRLRLSIDNIDTAIVAMLAQRFAATEQVGLAKAAAGFDALDPEREHAQMERLTALAQHMGLNPQIAREYLQFVTGESKRRHRVIREEQIEEQEAE